MGNLGELDHPGDKFRTELFYNLHLPLCRQLTTPSLTIELRRSLDERIREGIWKQLKEQLVHPLLKFRRE